MGTSGKLGASNGRQYRFSIVNSIVLVLLIADPTLVCAKSKKDSASFEPEVLVYTQRLAGFAAMLPTVAQPGVVKLPAGKGKEVVEAKCSTCHSLDHITKNRYSSEKWRNMIEVMTIQGLEITPQDTDVVLQYLTKHFSATLPAQSTVRPAEIPAQTKVRESSAMPESPSVSKVNVNTACEDELESKLKLTEREAAGIIAYRVKHGSFRAWKDLKNVSELETEKLKAIKDMLTF